MDTIPQRTLRNHVSEVLRRVEGGERIRVTVDGRPVADLLPIAGRRTFVSRENLEAVLRQAPLDSQFAGDIEGATGSTIEEL
jgi:prevent-host-death family protein